MKSFFLLIILPLIFISCTQNNHDSPIGVKSISELLEIAKKVHLSGDGDLLLRHSDISGVPPKLVKSTKKTLRTWSGIASEMKIKSVKVVSPADYDPYALIPEQWTEELKERFKASSKEQWNIKPEKYILITEELKVIKSDIDKKVNNRWVFGIFSNEGLWYFSFKM